MKKGMLTIFCFLFAINSYTVYALNDKQLELNKQHVIEFYQKALNDKNFIEASRYLGPHYIQHNPLAADGAEGLKAYIQFLQENFPNANSEIKRVFAEGNYVFLHVHAILEPGTRGNAIFDLFRLENGMIVEHWDTIQPIPEKSANPNGMF